MFLWKIILIVSLTTLLLSLIVWFYLFKVFLNKNGNKTVEEVSTKIKNYLYSLLGIGLVTVILLIVNFILKMIKM